MSRRKEERSRRRDDEVIGEEGAEKEGGITRVLVRKERRLREDHVVVDE